MCHLIRICTGRILVRNNKEWKSEQFRSWSDGTDVPADLDRHCLPMW
jgi:hypothetical protein